VPPGIVCFGNEIQQPRRLTAPTACNDSDTGGQFDLRLIEMRILLWGEQLFEITVLVKIYHPIPHTSKGVSFWGHRIFSVSSLSKAKIFLVTIRSQEPLFSSQYIFSKASNGILPSTQ
jgi:hypothetical protein